ncbi:MAG: hypothetical protein RIA69_01825 [Cyclobacteriaceae bacterium]
MKFSFLSSLFIQTNKSQYKEPVVDIIPDSEIENLIEAVVEEPIFESTSDSQIDQETQEKTQEIKVTPPTETTFIEPISFDLIEELNGSRFELNNQHKIVRITWNGKVNLETASKLLTLGANSVEFYGFTKLVLDRSNLTEFETEARVWIKDLLKNRAKKLSKKVEKMAIINATTTKGSIFSNFIASAINMVLPDLYMKKFDNEDEAFLWINNQPDNDVV